MHRRNCNNVGITDLNITLTSDEKIPFLKRWFDPGFEDEQKFIYLWKRGSKRNKILSKSLAIWPFAGYGRSKAHNHQKSGGAGWFPN